MALLAFAHSVDALQFTFATGCLFLVWSILCGMVGWKLRARRDRKGSEDGQRTGVVSSPAERSGLR